MLSCNRPEGWPDAVAVCVTILGLQLPVTAWCFVTAATVQQQQMSFCYGGALAVLLPSKVALAQLILVLKTLDFFVRLPVLYILYICALSAFFGGRCAETVSKRSFAGAILSLLKSKLQDAMHSNCFGATWSSQLQSMAFCVGT